MPVSNTQVTGKFVPLRDGVLIKDMEFGQTTTKGGIIIPGDDGKSRGVHPRWGQVIAIGKDQKDVQVGEWILVAHGRWSRGFKLNGETVRTADPKEILIASKDQPVQDYIPPSMGHTNA